MRRLRQIKLVIGACSVVLIGLASPAQAFDLDKGKAPFEVVGPTIMPLLLEVYPGGSDASLVLRTTTMVSNAWFDAIAPYHPTAVGVYSRLGRRPASESLTNRNKNIAIFYSSYRVLNNLLPKYSTKWRQMLLSVNLDPDDMREDKTTAVGIGNLAGKMVVLARQNDGMNELGNVGCKYNCRPYADYTGYKPANTAYALRNPSRWQPDIGSRGNGIFQVQQFATPQWGQARAYTYDDVSNFRSPAPVDSYASNRKAYRAQADEVLAVSAGLTDEQKTLAEFFNSKPTSLGMGASFITKSRNFDIDHTVQFVFLNYLATYDGGIATWNQKYHWDSVRPFSAIHYLYKDKPVTAWGGPGRGTVSDLPGSEWRSYLDTPDHPAYPSASACFCSAEAQASRRYLGSNTYGYSVVKRRGSSAIEPGITPASDITLTFNTYTDWAKQCAVSRVYGGVQFMAAIREGEKLCAPIGDRAYEFLKAHIDGHVN